MAGPYYTFAGVQALDGRIASGDQTTVDGHGASVDQEIENWLAPYTTSLPFVSPEIVSDITLAANYKTLARSLMAIYHDKNSADFWNKEYAELKASIIKRLAKNDSGATAVPGVVSNAGPWVKGPSR